MQNKREAFLAKASLLLLIKLGYPKTKFDVNCLITAILRKKYYCNFNITSVTTDNTIATIQKRVTIFAS
jgi:hypothetical protein